MSGVDWEAVWAFLWPILKEGLIALLIALLSLLGYDKWVPSRYLRGETRSHRRDGKGGQG